MVFFRYFPREWLACNSHLAHVASHLRQFDWKTSINLHMMCRLPVTGPAVYHYLKDLAPLYVWSASGLTCLDFVLRSFSIRTQPPITQPLMEKVIENHIDVADVARSKMSRLISNASWMEFRFVWKRKKCNRGIHELPDTGTELIAKEWIKEAGARLNLEVKQQ